ncbi:unnamed protein product [Prorocentrum cordatum]|uniref:Calpain catalytic domain-containing protein n=1 Tax=Prorocentrum cordatum TaxID=2364126 RepID=A0ABN9T1P2_9DINO|nr:unnamed protein product [Polarella glacialis]
MPAPRLATSSGTAEFASSHPWAACPAGRSVSSEVGVPAASLGGGVPTIAAHGRDAAEALWAVAAALLLVCCCLWLVPCAFGSLAADAKPKRRAKRGIAAAGAGALASESEDDSPREAAAPDLELPRLGGDARAGPPPEVGAELRPGHAPAAAGHRGHHHHGQPAERTRILQSSWQPLGRGQQASHHYGDDGLREVTQLFDESSIWPGQAREAFLPGMRGPDVFAPWRNHDARVWAMAILTVLPVPSGIPSGQLAFTLVRLEIYTMPLCPAEVLEHVSDGRSADTEVLDVFTDPDFGADADSWFSPNENRVASRLHSPNVWLRLQEFSMEVYPFVGDPFAGGGGRAGRVYQGEVEDFYLVSALQAIGMKPQLVANLFANMDYSDPILGVHTLRFYKHGQWVPVTIDDQLPFDREYNPLCITTEFWPDMGWASLAQKAYAKLHGSWSALGGGGHVEEALVDLTGGCASRFGTRDVAPDRLWQYLFDTQRWCVFACSIDEKAAGKLGIAVKSFWATSIWRVKKYDGIPYVCLCTSAPTATLRGLPHCRVPSEESYGTDEGFVWLRIDDFCSIYDIVYECRLVNSDLGSVEKTGIPYSPGWVVGYPWFEEMWAYQGDVFTEDGPLLSVRHQGGAKDPELTLEISQTDLRYDESRGLDRGRRVQAPLLLRFYQCSEGVSETYGGELHLVHTSAWGHARDAMCGVKVLKPGKFIAMVTLPDQYDCFRMIFRCYSTRPVAMKVVTAHRAWIAVQGSAPLHAIPYSLTGFMRVDSIGKTLPMLFNEADGKGMSMASPLAGNLPKRGDRSWAIAWHNLQEETVGPGQWRRLHRRQAHRRGGHRGQLRGRGRPGDRRIQGDRDECSTM